MIGAIAGDIIGSYFEWHNIKKKQFEIIHPKSHFTDDSVMTLAVAKALLDCDGDYLQLSDKAVQCMRELGARYPDCGFGGNFARWLVSEDPQPYNSYGNGSAMRVSACGWVAQSLDQAKDLSYRVTAVTHDHPEGLKGAEATAVAIYMAKTGASKQQIRDVIANNYYPMDFTLDEIRPSYYYNISCQKSVPQAIEAFLEARDFEDAVRNAVSLGGDSDTLGAIAGSIAEAYFGVPRLLRELTLKYLDDYLRDILQRFEKFFPSAND